MTSMRGASRTAAAGRRTRARRKSERPAGCSWRRMATQPSVAATLSVHVRAGRQAGRQASQRGLGAWEVQHAGVEWTGWQDGDAELGAGSAADD